MRIGVFGQSSIGRRHAKLIEELGHSVVTCDPVRPAMTTSANVIWLQVDAVVIATPPATHWPLMQQAAAYGLPMLVEKPLALPEEIAAIEAWQAPPPVLVGYQWRYAPELQRICERPWRSWGIAHYHGSLNGRESPWLTDPRQGGGVLLEYSHAIDYALWSCQQLPLEVLAHGNEYEAILILNGGFPQIYLSFNGDPPIGQLRIWQHEWDRRESDLEQCYRDEMRHFLDVIEGKRSPRVTLQDGLAVLEVVRAARRSFETHRWERTAHGERRLSGASAK